MLSYEYWIKSFGGDLGGVNKSFTRNDKVHTVIGGLPPVPQYPNENDVYMPTTACPFRSRPSTVANRQARMVQVFGRMKPGMSVSQAQADLSGVAANLQKAYPKDYPEGKDYSVKTTALEEALTHNARPTMLVLLAAAGFVLLIACANVANLNLSRMVRRERELAVRAALMLRRFAKLQHVDPGFQPENVLTMDVSLDFVKYNTGDKQRAFFESLLEKIQMQSGVKSAAASMMIPFTAGMTMTGDFQIEGQAPAPGQALPKADFRIVSPSYFDALHIPILNGRGFLQTDRPGNPDVAVLNRSAAIHLWGSHDPVGTRFSADGGKTWNQVVGVVGDIKQDGLDKDVVDEIYVPMAQNPMGQASLVVKTVVEPMSIASGVIELLHGVDPNQPAARVRSLEQVRAESVAAPRLTTNLLGLFAMLALAIAATGIGGVLALAVGQRQDEIGGRMAIGARPAEILRMILGQGMALALIGVALGLFGALWLTRLLQQLLFEVAPTDPLTYVGVAVVLGLAALLACYVPARRASRVDPIVALRVEEDRDSGLSVSG